MIVLKQQKSNSDTIARPLYHKKRFGSEFPSFTKEDFQKYGKLISTKSIREFEKKIVHSDLYYKAMKIIKKNNW